MSADTIPVNFADAVTMLAIFGGSLTPQLFVPLDDNKERRARDLAGRSAAAKSGGKYRWEAPFAPAQLRTLTDAFPWLVEMNRQGMGIFFTINEVDGKPALGKTSGHGRMRENITRLRVVVADDDTVRTDGMPRTDWPLRPSLVVNTSPGKFQYYWVVEGLSIDEGEAVNRSIAERFQCDRATVDPSRVLRLAGFCHCKREPYLVRIADASQIRYGRDAILQAFPPAVIAPRPAPVIGSANVALVRSALTAIPHAQRADYHDWINVGLALYNEFRGEDEGRELFAEWSDKPDDADEKWASFKGYVANPRTVGTIFWQAQVHGNWDMRAAQRAAALTQMPPSPSLRPPGAPGPVVVDPAGATMATAMAPVKRSFQEIEADIQALAAFASNGAADFIERITPLMNELIINDFDPLPVKALMAQIAKSSGKLCTTRDLNKHYNTLAKSIRAQVKQQASASTGLRVDVLAELLKIEDAVLPNIANAEVYIRANPVWDGAIGWDEFSHRIVVRKALPWPRKPTNEWTDADTTELHVWLQRQCEGLRTVSRGTIEPLPVMIAKRNPFHAVCDKLNSLVWDGVSRLESFGTGYLRIHPETESQARYVRAVFPKFFIGCVARVFRPGCKLDTALIIESNLQGFKKSTLYRIMAMNPDWFSDSPLDIGGKDGMHQLAGVWIYELAELEAMDRRSVNANKQFMSSQSDRFRPPYGRYVETYPRQCAIVGSTNNDEYLRDKTGNRRYWPVRIECEVDLEIIRRDIEQLWAEAVQRFKNGETWWFDSAQEADARLEQDDRLPQDDTTPAVLEAAKKLKSMNIDHFTLDQLMVEMKINGENLDNRFKGRIASVLTRHGFIKRRPWAQNPARSWFFYHPS